MSRLPGPVRWYGGKGKMIAKLLPLIPYTHIYVEPYGGTGSILMNRKPSPVEIYNDLDGDLVNLFRILQSPLKAMKLKRRLAATLYSLIEFEKASNILKSDEGDPLERAWAFYVVQNQGFSGKNSSKMTRGNWARTFTSNRGMSHTTSRWWSRFDHFDDWHKRISRCQIDSRDAIEVIKYWDSPETTFYLDPPYVAETRMAGSRNIYKHEVDECHHDRLVETLLTIEGNAVLSGYPSPVYDRLDKAGWERIAFLTACHAANKARRISLQGKGAVLARAPRTEVVWRNRPETGKVNLATPRAPENPIG